MLKLFGNREIFGLLQRHFQSCLFHLDGFADILIRICGEDAEYLHSAPHTLGISRPDEVKAAKEPILRWKPKE